MTVLIQARVKAQVAQNFKRAARLRGKTSYAYLQQMIEQAAAAPKPGTWDDHWKQLARIKNKPLPYNTVARQREEADER